MTADANLASSMKSPIQSLEGDPEMTEGIQAPAPEAATDAEVSIEDFPDGAQVTAEGKWAVAECPEHEWRSRLTLWWAIAQDRAAVHNKTHHAVLNPNPVKES